MRVCFISRRFFPTISGMSVYAANLLAELVRNRVETVMIAQYRDDETGKRVYGGGAPHAVAGGRVIGLESVGEQTNGDFETDTRKIVETVVAEHNRKPFDLIHAQYGYPPGFAALQASRILNVPNVVSIQGGDGHWVGVECCATHRAAMRAVLTNANRILIGSRSFAEEVRENHRVDVSDFTIVPGAVDTERFQPRDDWRAGETIEKDVLKLLYHGRVDRRKGALDLIESFAGLISNGEIRAKLLISGIGPDAAAAAALIEKLNLQNSIEMLGYVDYKDVPEIYRRADVFVSPTYAEGFSNTILEAMASGLAIVSTKAVGVVDCLRDGENGLLVAPGNVAELTDALQRIASDQELRKKLAANALSECRETYSWRKIGRQIVEIYDAVKTEKPRTDWTVSDEIAPCRYRETPHLL